MVIIGLFFIFFEVDWESVFEWSRLNWIEIEELDLLGYKKGWGRFSSCKLLVMDWDGIKWGVISD